MEVYERIRHDLPQAVPFWPLGLPGRTDPWLALGMRAGRTTYITVWHREGEPAGRALPLPHLQGLAADVDILYPATTPGTATWSNAPGELTVTLPRTPTALLLRLTT